MNQTKLPFILKALLKLPEQQTDWVPIYKVNIWLRVYKTDTLLRIFWWHIYHIIMHACTCEISTPKCFYLLKLPCLAFNKHIQNAPTHMFRSSIIHIYILSLCHWFKEHLHHKSYGLSKLAHLKHLVIVW